MKVKLIKLKKRPSKMKILFILGRIFAKFHTTESIYGISKMKEMKNVCSTFINTEWRKRRKDKGENMMDDDLAVE